MYTKNARNYVNFFKSESAEKNTEKVAYGRISEAIKQTGTDGAPLMQDGKQVYEFETWNARFVGKAKKKFDENPLKDKDSIILTEWAVRNPYSKEKKQSFPYILVMDYELNER